MCGIVGKISTAGKRVTLSQIKAMTTALAHRGPDDVGFYFSPQEHVGLGHRRLSIIDLSPLGHQPMSLRDRYWIVFCGEIYNYQEKRALLEKSGYRFRSQTDTEVILGLYHEYGVNCLEHLRGMFAFAIYDTEREELFCARDRVGKKPFKYYWDGQYFIFASELKAILTQPEYRREVDYTAIHHYLTLQYCPAPYTGFKDIQKLEPAHYLLLDIKRKTLLKQRYWRLAYSPKKNRTQPQWQQLIKDKLREAVKLRMVADVPVGAFLSGGVDSSAIVALMSELSTRPIKTFSIGFQERAFSELPYAQKVARQFKTEHTEFLVKPSALDTLSMLVAQYEEPYADSSALPTYYLSKLARQHVTVALNGDGGDENFAGYSRYNIQKFSLLCDTLGIAKLPGLSAAGRELARNFPTTFFDRLRRFTATLPDDYRSRYVNYICYFSNSMKSRLYNPSFRYQLQEDSYRCIMTKFDEAATSDPLDQTLYADIATYLPEDLLVKVDIASMAVALEARSPFLDHEFMELCASMPFNLKLRGWRSNKYILKEAFADVLPQEILHRSKQGFVVPIESWFRGDLQQYLRSILVDNKQSLIRQLFNQTEVARLLRVHTSTRINLAPPLWALLTLELWYQHYFKP